MLFLSLLLPLLSLAYEAPIHELEAHCWSQSVEDGAVLCQDVVLIGKVEGSFVYPLLSPEDGRDKALLQADITCKALGFGTTAGFHLDHTVIVSDFIHFDPSGAAYLSRRNGSYIRHLLCR